MKSKFILVAMLLASLSFGAAWEQSASVQNIKAAVSSNKPLVVGRNELVVTLKQQNKPIENAVVEVKGR